PARAAAVRSPAPPTHARRTSQISATATSRNPTPRTPKPIDLKAPGTGSDQDPKAAAPGGPITANRGVPGSWQKAPKGGPMLVAGDSSRITPQTRQFPGAGRVTISSMHGRPQTPIDGLSRPTHR